MNIKARKILAVMRLPRSLFLAGAILVLVGFCYNIFFKNPNIGKLASSSETLFLENLMIREWGLYTLLGSKPVTVFDIQDLPIKEEKDLRKSYGELKAHLEKAEEEKGLPEAERTAFNPGGVVLPTYEEYKKGWESKGLLNPKELWDQWKATHQTLNPKFRIFSRKAPFGEGKLGLFINIPSLIFVLHQYQKEISQRTGVNYVPHEIVLEIEDESSFFWNQVFQDHFLFGLICGYGERSAYLFDWSNDHFPTIASERRNFLINNGIQDRINRAKKDICPKNLSIPVFFHFGLTDPMKMNYELEREKIIEYFQEKDFTETTLDVLLEHR